MRIRSINRDAVIVLALVTIILLCLPLLGMLFGDFHPATMTNASTPGVTPTLAARAYLLPFRQVFAIGLAEPMTRTTFLLYENGTDVFQMIDQRGANTRLQTLDAKMNFWTATENVSLTPTASAQYDLSGRNKVLRLIPATGYACLHEDAPPPLFSTCQPLPNFSSARLSGKMTSGSVVVYLVEIDGKAYYVPPEIILTIP
jgi:hypothetical protein